MHEFIGSIAARLTCRAYAARAQTIFGQAMKKRNVRWGRNAKLTAGASLAIALRESHKSDMLRDIAVSFRYSSLKSLSLTASSIVSLRSLPPFTLTSLHFRLRSLGVEV